MIACALRVARSIVHKRGVAALARADEDKLPAIRGEGGLIVVRGIVGQTFERGAVGLHPKQICGSRALGREDERLSVGGKRRIVIDVGRAQQRALVAAVSRRDEQSQPAWIGRDPSEDDLLRRCVCARHAESGGDDDDGDESHFRIVELDALAASRDLALQPEKKSKYGCASRLHRPFEFPGLVEESL